jgi:hypothetical protein
MSDGDEVLAVQMEVDRLERAGSGRGAAFI